MIPFDGLVDASKYNAMEPTLFRECLTLLNINLEEGARLVLRCSKGGSGLF